MIRTSHLFPGEDTCKGDGGGPLVCPSSDSDSRGSSSYVQAGIVSWGVDCGRQGVPSVYTDVASAMCFIDWATRFGVQFFKKDS